MAEVIRQTKSLTDEEKQRLFGWGDNIFGVGKLNLNWRSKDLHFLAYSDDEPISHVGILSHVIAVNGKSVTVGGIGGVVTIPEAQKKGFARLLMQHTANFLEHDWQVTAGLLFCLPVMEAYYKILGWQKVETPVLIDQPNGKMTSPLSVMVLSLCNQDWLDGKIELHSPPW